MNENNGYLFSEYDEAVKFSEIDDSIFLAGGTSENMEIEEFQEYKNFDIINHYADTKGNDELKSIYIDKCITLKNVSANNLLVTNGATAAIYATLKSFVKPEEVVGILSPCWSLYEAIATDLGITVSYLKLDLSEGEKYKVEDIKSFIQTDVKVILLANPSNPLGHFLDNEIIKELILFAEYYGKILIIDETYFGLSSGESTSFFPYINSLDNIVVIRSLSKFYRSPGIRIGFTIASVKNTLKLHNTAKNMYLVPSSLSQMIGIQIVKNFNTLWHKKYCLRNLEKLLSLEERMPNLKVIKPDILFFCCIQISNEFGQCISTEEIFNKTRLVLRDADNFGLPNFNRLNLCINEGEMNVVIKRLETLNVSRLEEI